MSAEVRQARTVAAVLTLVRVVSRSKPLLVAVEDLHWVDAASESLLSALVDDLGNSRVLLIVTHRPDRRVPWVGRPRVSNLVLSPLGPEDSKALLTGVLGDRANDAALLDDLAIRAQGNALFLEELSLALKETGHDDHVPETIHGVLMARIDALPRSVRRALQTASVPGREFQRRLFHAVWQRAERLGDLILELENLQLMHERLERDESILSFRHALVQDAAYGTLVRARRRELSVDLLQAEQTALDESRWPALTAPCHFWLGHMLVRQSRYREAEASARKAIDQAQAAGDDGTVGKAMGVLCLSKCLTGESMAINLLPTASGGLIIRAG